MFLKKEKKISLYKVFVPSSEEKQGCRNTPFAIKSVERSIIDCSHNVWLYYFSGGGFGRRGVGQQGELYNSYDNELIFS